MGTTTCTRVERGQSLEIFKYFLNVFLPTGPFSRFRERICMQVYFSLSILKDQITFYFMASSQPLAPHLRHVCYKVTKVLFNELSTAILLLLQLESTGWH